jgi:RNA 3'-terminal phosphate cyclase
VLEEIRQQWIAENGSLPLGNGEQESRWTQPIDAKLTMTDQEKADWHNTDGLGQVKLLKSVARRLESEIQAQLKRRGCQEDLRFNPKLKEEGLLDLK